MLDPALELQSAPGLLEHFRMRAEPKFFASFADRESTIAELRRRWPRAEAEIVEQADRLSKGRFDLLGLKDLSFGDPIDWQFEPVSGKRVPLLHWSRLDYLDADVSGDNKIIWELNRHQYFGTLGQAYWLTGDEHYARTFVSHLESWMDQNPPKLGINWASSLELSFRAISWLWAFHFFKDSPSLAMVFIRTLKLLYLQARHLETYLSTYFSPNTHLTGEALGLFYLGTLLPEFKAARRWRETGRSILLEQLSRHVRPDGVYFEQSSYYHRYTADFYTHFLILARLNGQSVPDELTRKLKALLDHLMYITRPDGTTPFFGDDDGGRLVMLDRREANDFRAALSTGAALFGRGDYKYIARGVAEETLLLLGVGGLREFDSLPAEEPEEKSVAFRDGGYYVMRDDWTSTANYLRIDCGPHGTDNCGHAHADVLSFELAVNGRTLLVDPGTYTYTGSKEMRSWFRSSAAHNTLTVDGQSSSVSAGPFSWKSIAQPGSPIWIARGRCDYFEGTHDGYSRLADPVTHSRSVLFLKGDYWVLRDRLESNSEHRHDLWFHLDAGANPVVLPKANTVTTTAGESGLEIAIFGGKGDWNREDGWVSQCYGKRTAAPVCVYSVTAKGQCELITFLLPMISASAARTRIHEVEAVGGRAFEIVAGDKQDIVMIRKGHRVEMARMASDFAWTWVRFSAMASVPEELVLLDGQSLELEGHEILKSGRRINYLVASRVGDKFRLETDEGVLDLELPIHNFERAFLDRRSGI